MMLRPFSMLDVAALTAFVIVAAILIERGHRRDIEAPGMATAIAAAPSCLDALENRRFVIRRMLIADGSLALGNIWRSEAFVGACAN
jgi:hypothetical protein